MTGHFVTLLLLVYTSSVSCFDTIVAVGQECFSELDCTADKSSEALVQCSHGVCVCDSTKSHYVYKYSDVYNQIGVACQNRSLGRICLGIYHHDNSCACSPGKVAFKLPGKNGYCVEDDSTHQGFGAYCSAVMTACEASLGLTCRNSHCFCAQDTHFYNLTQQRCVRKAGHLLGHNEPCSDAADECQHRFSCRNGKCQCDPSCGPYLDAEGICACENTGWRLVLLKVVPMVCVVLVLLIIAGAIFLVSTRRRKGRRSPCHQELPGHQRSPHQGDAPADSVPLNGSIVASDSFLNASAPPLDDLDFDDAPPPYEEAIKATAVR